MEASPHPWQKARASARLYALAVFAVVCFVGGLFVSQPLMFVSVPLTLLLVFTGLRWTDPRPNVRVDRTTERVQIREGESVGVRLRVRNLSYHPLSLLQVIDTVDSELRGPATRNAFSSSLGPRAQKDFYYQVKGNSFGVHSLGPITLRVQDGVGFFESVCVLESRSKLIVLPATEERIAHLAIRPRKTKPWPGEIMARRAGAGLDYYSVRRFTAGDPMKHINWRASARHAQANDELLVNERIAEVGAEVLIIVDGGRTSTAGMTQDAPTVYSVKAAISIAERLLRDRNRVGLLTTGKNARRIPAGYGKRQFDRIAMTLLQVEAGDSDFRWWVECSIHMFFPNISQIIFVSPLADEDSISAATELARYGERDVIVVAPNTIGASEDRRPPSRERKIALKLAQMEREVEIARLRSANVLVVDWKTSSSLEEVMHVHERALTKYAAFTARRG